MYRYLKSVFDEAQDRIRRDPNLYRLTAYAVRATRVYPEGCEATGLIGGESLGVEVTREKTLEAARRLSKRYQRVGVLNFANAVTPGGATENGIPSQEGDLCRQTNLYPCLEKTEVWEHFYSYNNRQNQYYSDRVIYSPGVTVFRDAQDRPLEQKDWFWVDVLSCPAPNLNGITVPDYRNLEQIYRFRIRNILSVAQENGIQALVLGAFGCGQLCNVPEWMAEAFRGELARTDFQYIFSEVVFAVWPGDAQEAYTLNVFQNVLTPWTREPFYRKNVAIIGDFASTVQEDAARVDPWWNQVLARTGARLLCNYSWNENRVCGTGWSSLGSVDVASALAPGGQTPDVILVAVGANDYEAGAPINPAAGGERDGYEAYFRASYQMLLWKLRAAYPGADIYCATISCGVLRGCRRNAFPEGVAGVPLRKYNRTIRECALEYGCRVADLEKFRKCHETEDGRRPTARGMRQLADAWLEVFDAAAGVKKERTIPAGVIAAGASAGVLAAGGALVAVLL